MKRFIETIKPVWAGLLLALVFLGYIFYIGVVTFPITRAAVAEKLADQNIGVLSVRDAVDDSFRNLLSIGGGFTTNKATYIDYNGLLANFMGQRYMNERVKLNNGHLTYLSDPCDTADFAAQIINLYRHQQQGDKRFVFVLAPAQVPKYENILPAGYSDYSNENGDHLIETLRANGVPVLDLRDAMADDGLVYSDSFYVTDHHWTTQTGFWAYTRIVDYLVENEMIGPVDAKYTDINNFTTETYSRWFLGSASRRTGIYFAGVDDFSVIRPGFENGGVTFEVPSKSIFREGDFAEVCFDSDAIQLGYYIQYPYNVYMDNDFERFRNPGAPVDLKVLSLGDSFTNVPSVYLPLIFQNCDELDMRYYHDDFAAYYTDYDPDIIICLINVASLDASNTGYTFFGG